MQIGAGMARLPCRKTPSTEYMPKKFSDVAIEKVPSLCNRISLFQSKLAIAHYAHGTITDYCHAIYKAVGYIGKLPDVFSQDDVDGYLQSMLSRKPIPAEAQFKHFVYGLKCYRQTMDCTELRGLSLPKIRREKKLPRILSFQQVMRMLRLCTLYPKTLLSVIYDCGLRAFEACNLKWNDIYFDRQQVHIKKGKGGKDRIVPISPETLFVLKAYRKNYPSKNFIFKKFGKDAPITPDFIRARLKEALVNAELDASLTTHSLRHSYATHLLEAGEDIQTVQQRLGHKSVSTTMIYLHLAKIEKRQCVNLISNNLWMLKNATPTI